MSITGDHIPNTLAGEASVWDHEIEEEAEGTSERMEGSQEVRGVLHGGVRGAGPAGAARRHRPLHEAGSAALVHQSTGKRIKRLDCSVNFEFSKNKKEEKWCKDFFTNFPTQDISINIEFKHI